MYPHHYIDWQGIATVIGAVGGFLTVLVTLGIQIINFRDQRKMRDGDERREAKLDQVHATVTQVANVLSPNTDKIN